MANRTHRDKPIWDDPHAVFEMGTFDFGAIAYQLKATHDEAAKDKKKELVSPKLAHLADAITGVTVTDTIEGSSTLEVSVADPEFELFEFFDIDHNGKLDTIEMQYPPGSPNWWRLTGLSASTAAGQALTLTLIFMERPAVLLLHKRGPKKGKRGKMTRAQFLQSCVRDVKDHPLKFHSSELTTKQEIAGTQIVSDKDRKDSKGGGIHKGEDVTVKGVKINGTQIKQANRALDEAKRQHAPHDAAVALIMTAIGESTLGLAMSNQGGSKYSGVFAADPANVDPQDTETMAKYCLIGGKGFNAPEGGLIGGVKSMSKGGTAGASGSSQYRSLGHLCYVNQGNLSNFGSAKLAEDFFGKWESEAEDIVQAYGDGFSGGDTYFRKQFNFQIGSPDEPKQRYWDGMRDLADDVRWRLFVDGRTIYFDSDMTLIRQKPAAIISRTGPAVIGYDATWDGERHLATEMTLELICEPFQFRAGQVLKLTKFGPLSNGSTAKPKGLPGRWLIWEIVRSSSSYSSTFTLRQPERERLEPEADIGTRPDVGTRGGGLRDVDNTMTPKEIIDELILPIGRKHNAHASIGGPLTAANVTQANHQHNAQTTSGNLSNHNGPPNERWAADMSYPGSDQGHVNPDGNGLADELARKFGFHVAPNHVYAFDQSPTKDGLQYELGWRTLVGGNHFTHVHFGVKVVDVTKRHDTPETPPRGTPDSDPTPHRRPF